MLGLNLVSDYVCHACSFRDHKTNRNPQRSSPHLLTCLMLGQPLAEKGRSESAPLQQVHECLHPNHVRTTVAQCQDCPDYLFPVITELTPVSWVRRMLDFPPQTQPAGWWNLHNVQEA